MNRRNGKDNRTGYGFEIAIEQLFVNVPKRFSPTPGGAPETPKIKEN